MLKKENQQIILVALIVIATAILRVFNASAHIYHLVPLAAIGVFSGSILSNKRMSYIIPIAAMFLSDLGIATVTHMPAFYGISQLVNYFAVALVTFMGTFMVRRNVTNILGYSISGSMIFFLLSNFGTFLSGYYGYHYTGFVECFTMAIPFYKNDMANTLFMNSFLGDLTFSFLAFGLVYFLFDKKSTVQVA